MKITDIVGDLARAQVRVRGRDLEMRALSAYEWRRLVAQWPEPPAHFVDAAGKVGPPDPDARGRGVERELGLRSVIVGLALGIDGPEPQTQWNPAAEGPGARKWLEGYAEMLQRSLTFEEIAGLYTEHLTPLCAGTLNAGAARGN